MHMYMQCPRAARLACCIAFVAVQCSRTQAFMWCVARLAVWIAFVAVCIAAMALPNRPRCSACLTLPSAFTAFFLSDTATRCIGNIACACGTPMAERQRRTGHGGDARGCGDADATPVAKGYDKEAAN